MGVHLWFNDSGLELLADHFKYVIPKAFQNKEYGYLILDDFGGLRLTVGTIRDRNPPFSQMVGTNPKILICCDLTINSLDDVMIEFSGTTKDLTWLMVARRPADEAKFRMINFKVYD